ncbi:hypothetical protein ACJQWK_09651 [Exserohilum turcicum]|uniref:Uncharacterized protein n=1 Tax=Exserohilum turcicum (strain 28A) TaxID=671987 RepID=R0I545_EXST2|nr:uncharacterized protein SETTUDRAFT_181893 [Exserohilum turcica Et28A]EOA80686.1 hypothetical protein SETTUDRAFT_181893 [Exserohilum turcica Et28A]
MAAVGTHDDKLAVLAHRGHQDMGSSKAARATQRKETDSEMEHHGQRNVNVHLENPNAIPPKSPRRNLQPLPSSRLASPSLEQSQPPRSKLPSSSAGRVDMEIANSTSTQQVPSKSPMTSLAESGVLPGVNQADPEDLANKMPGKTQPKPSLDAAALSLLPMDSPSTSWATVTTFMTSTQTISAPTQTTSSSEMGPGFAWPTPTTLTTTTTAAPSFSEIPLPSISSFVLFSKSEDLREQATPPALLSSSSFTTAEAITASLLPSTPPLPTVVPTPSSFASASNGNRRTGLTPLSRSLFVLFGVLGVITLIIAAAIFFVGRRNRKREEALAEQYAREARSNERKRPISNTSSRYDDDQDIPVYMTDSERNIVRRAATQDGQPEMNITAPGARLHDAINTFIAKSRRLTYKISP